MALCDYDVVSAEASCPDSPLLRRTASQPALQTLRCGSARRVVFSMNTRGRARTGGGHRLARCNRLTAHRCNAVSPPPAPIGDAAAWIHEMYHKCATTRAAWGSFVAVTTHWVSCLLTRSLAGTAGGMMPKWPAMQWRPRVRNWSPDICTLVPVHVAEHARLCGHHLGTVLPPGYRSSWESGCCAGRDFLITMSCFW